jgi:GAF domain-containing protein
MEHGAQYLYYVSLIFVGLLLVVVVGMARARNVDVKLWGVTFSSNPKIGKLKKVAEDLQRTLDDSIAYSSQKSQILRVMNIIVEETAELVRTRDPAEFAVKVDKVYDLVKHGVTSALGSSRDNVNRLTIFVQDDKDQERLKLLNSFGFPSKEIKHVDGLPKRNTCAGYVFHTGRPYHSGNVKEDKTCYKELPEVPGYPSLACVPIFLGDESAPYGVLCLDGAKENCFTDEDVLFVSHFASVIGLLLEIQRIQARKGEGYGAGKTGA